MPIDYNSDLLQGFADRLYQQAKWLAQWTAAKYGLSAALVAGAGTWLIESVQLSRVINSIQYSRMAGDAQSTSLFVAVVAGAVAALLGYSIGAEKGFALRLQAQQLLLQMRIEQNTRKMSVDGQVQGGYAGQ